MAGYILILQNELVRRHLRRERVFRDRNNPLDHLSDNEVLRNYRFTQQSIFHLTDIFGEHLNHPTRRNFALPPQQQLLIALRIFATGAPQHVFPEIFGIEKSTVCKIITSVIHVISAQLQEYVIFPNTPDTIHQSKQQFLRLCEMPTVLGAVDCTHIRLYKAPLKDSEPVYINRKNWHSINVQIVGDINYKILNIVARWPGSAQDNFIFRGSGIGNILEAEGENGAGCLLGDSGYYQRPWLMTPHPNPLTEGQRSYNRAHRRGRVVIEQLNGQFKQKFPCLVYGLRIKAAKACSVILACAVLYNISKSLNEPVQNDLPADQLGNNVLGDDGNDGQGLLHRDIFIQTHFG